MPFSSGDQIIESLTSGKSYKAVWSKNFQPTTVGIANEVHTMFRGAGNPGADTIFNAGSNLVFQPVKDVTSGAASIMHGGNVQGTGVTKHLINASAVTAAATMAPGWLVLVDVVGFYRLTTVTTATAQATTNTLNQSDTFTADAGTDICTYTSTANSPSNLLTGTRIRVSTTTTLPAGLAAVTDYYLIRIDDSTFKLATTYANAIAGTVIDITSAGTGTHTVQWLLPRYTNGAGLEAIMFNSNATPLGAATPNMSLVYTNSTQTGSRATPTVLPVGKTACPNSQILYSGATAVGKYNYAVPKAGGDAGIAQIDSIQNSTSYVSGEYSTALVKELCRLPITTLGVGAERNLQFEMPSLPRIYDGAALYWLWIAGVATPVNSGISGHLDFVWR